jgi:hypothetical protein
MSEGELISHSSDVTVTPAKTEIPAEPVKAETPAELVKAETPVEAPKIESPTIQPQIEIAQAEPAPAIVTPSPEPVIDTVAKEIAPEIPAAEAKMPPVAQLAEPVARLVEAAPPDFLREHATRVIAAKPPLRAEQRLGSPPGFKPKVAPKPEIKAETKTPPKTERAARETPRQTRFALLAASLALCAGIGSALGSVGIASLSRFSAPPAAGTAADVQTLREQIAQLSADLAATRTNVEHINRTNVTQFGKIVERFDRAERAQAEPAAKLAKIGETVDKLEKRIAALPPAPIAAAAPPPATANDVTGSIAPRPAPEAKAPPKPTILESFVLRRVYDGVALVEGRMGMVELVPGAPLPGGGRVEDIKREDGHWVVVTTKGLIVSQR